MFFLIRSMVFTLTAVMYCSLSAQEVSRSLYVLNGLGRTVSKMDLTTNEIRNDLAVVGTIPNRIYSYNHLIYIVNSTPAGISVFDPRTNQIIKSIVLAEGSNPYDMVFSGTQKAYISNLLANTLSIVDLQSGTVLDEIAVGIAPEGMIIVNNLAFVANSGGYPAYSGASVSVIDIETDQVLKTLKCPANPQDLALGPDGNVYVICTGNYADQTGKLVIHR